jgi:hypothetical protein
MGKCEQCIVREFSAIKALNKDELLKIADMELDLLMVELFMQII